MHRLSGRKLTREQVQEEVKPQRWRHADGTGHADLHGVDLSNIDLHGIDFFQNCDLGESDLRGANLAGARLNRANLRGARLEGANLSGADLRQVDFHGRDLSRMRLAGANLRGANLTNVDLSHADLTRANLSGFYSSHEPLSLGTRLSGANLTSARLRGADLRGTDLSEANLQGADLLEVKTDAQTKVPDSLTWLIRKHHEPGVFFQDNRVLITSEQAVVWGKRLPFIQMESVGIREKPPRPLLAIAVSIAGSVFACLSVTLWDDFPGTWILYLALSILMVAFGVFLAKTSKTKYCVVVQVFDQDQTEVLATEDEAYARQIANALSQAIKARRAAYKPRWR